ncbi:hypothetical protein FB45DRAFT_1056262 [Roridomyces roridus]|uniref:Uncharacterized protein n=1 Tax=Roridomyces roridus TaxID=1738132 RepID=A0AAD7FTH0_9AGAR|nr:hypothetical protein FB45DRAFT_1056262 [Roridomyces roridus]
MSHNSHDLRSPKRKRKGDVDKADALAAAISLSLLDNANSASIPAAAATSNLVPPPPPQPVNEEDVKALADALVETGNTQPLSTEQLASIDYLTAAQLNADAHREGFLIDDDQELDGLDQREAEQMEAAMQRLAGGDFDLQEEDVGQMEICEHLIIEQYAAYNRHMKEAADVREAERLARPIPPPASSLPNEDATPLPLFELISAPPPPISPPNAHPKADTPPGDSDGAASDSESTSLDGDSSQPKSPRRKAQQSVNYLVQKAVRGWKHIFQQARERREVDERAWQEQLEMILRCSDEISDKQARQRFAQQARQAEANRQAKMWANHVEAGSTDELRSTVRNSVLVTMKLHA